MLFRAYRKVLSLLLGAPSAVVNTQPVFISTLPHKQVEQSLSTDQTATSPTLNLTNLIWGAIGGAFLGGLVGGGMDTVAGNKKSKYKKDFAILGMLIGMTASLEPKSNRTRT